MNSTASQPAALRVVVIGAGIVGAACAIELLRDGHHVTLIDPGEPGGTQATSYGNAAWLSPASVVPVSMPGLWKKIPGYLFNKNSPLTIRWSALPSLLPWLIRFIWAGASVARVEATARALSALLHDAPARHRALAKEAGVAELIVSSGLLYAYPDRAAFDAEALAWRLRRDNGVNWAELDAQAIRELVPELDRRYQFAILVEQGAHCADPGAYVAALVRHAVKQGAALQRAKASRFDLQNGRLRAVITDIGELACDRAVIAAGINSKILARSAGDKIIMESERGYHVVIENPPFKLAVPVMPNDAKTGNTSTLAGLRIAGQVELTTMQAAPDWSRAETLLRHAVATYPVLATSIKTAVIQRWMGHRPSTTDGRPVLGAASGCQDVIHAFGHGHIGLASGPVSGRLVADLVSGRPTVIDPAPYAAKRFL
ncbi:D-amino-acid dehydrogenase [Collimonas sp. OK607]|uniref:NAD(P)/FAD-dependent oxidoreductase n=1 Tax=Collimonas sp. OK607 TaxID=1798194 RepID=UPI0008F088AA|nr:FAD-binding oxidoreductase [Collimonas sp. OK607]SFB06090.1 D-amino-acid dehydrogenase [Collimonas sp. OK607]